jgi:hypothetical protein
MPGYLLPPKNLSRNIMSNELIRNCKFRFQCGIGWQDLDTTSSENIRVCRACGEQVHLCVSDDELRRAMEANHCVAIRIENESMAAEHSLPRLFGHDDKYGVYDKNEAVDLLLEQDPPDQDFCDDEDDTDLEFEAVDPVSAQGSPAHDNRDDEDDTDLEFESIDSAPEQGSINQDNRDDEDDTDLKFESIEREGRPTS